MSIDHDVSTMAAKRIARRLAAHRWVAAARAEAGTVLVTPAAAAVAAAPQLGELVAEYLEHWGEIYDWLYANPGDHADDLAGWCRSDTGQPFEVDHMVDWADRAAELAIDGRPHSVLEIGCGTGLLARRLRDHVDRYVGADLVPRVPASFGDGRGGSSVFIGAAAHDICGEAIQRALRAVRCPPAGPDCVLLNSVVQYFPNLDYLRVVLRAAVQTVAPGGRVVVGDLRHAGLLERFCRWAERAADPEAAPADIALRARTRADKEPELLIDPVRLARLLTDVEAETGREIHMSVRPKQLRADTELTRYRFDAVLLVDPPPATPDPPAVDWAAIAPPRVRLEALAEQVARGPVRVSGIPNRVLTDAPDAVTPYQLRVATQGLGGTVLLDCADPTRLAVVHPAEAAAHPVAEAAGPGIAHEPFGIFVRRRLLEVARPALRAELPDGPMVPISVEMPS